MTNLEEIARRHLDSYWDDDVTLDDAMLAAMRELREELAKLAEQDAMVVWTGGSTGNGPMTADKIAACIRRWGEE